MSIRVNITSILCVYAIFLCLECQRNSTAESIKECMKSQTAEICIKIYKGL